MNNLGKINTFLNLINENVFTTLGKAAIKSSKPLLKKAGKTLKDVAIQTGAEIGGDLLTHGKNKFSEVAKKRGHDTIDNFSEKIMSKKYSKDELKKKLTKIAKQNGFKDINELFSYIS